MIELNKIYCGDCCDIMKQVPDNFVDLTITSPPYDNLRKYKDYVFNFEDVITELFRITKRGGVVVWVVGDATIKGSETGTSFKQALFFKSVGFNLHDTMIYRKINPIPLTHNRYEQGFEYMFVFSKGKPKTFNAIKIVTKSAGSMHNRAKSNKEIGSSVRNRNEITITKSDKIRDNVWDIAVSSAKYDHPAIFPEKLVYDHIISWSNSGDIVLDPMCGSGTTCKMAKITNRNYIGIDISEEYCDITRKRVGELLNEK